MIHTAGDRTPYTYVIRNLITGKRYYGCRYAKDCQPGELWITYFTSSKIIKKMLKETGKDNWVYEIRHVFTDVVVCKAWEETVLRRLGVPKNERWYNQSIGGKKFLLQGEALELLKQNNSIRMKELHRSPEYKEQRKNIMELRWGKPGAKEKHSSQIKECWKDPEWAKRIIQERKERLATPKVRQQRSETSLKNWTRPEYVENHKASMAIVRADPIWLENNREHMRKAWTDPEKKNNMLKNRPIHSKERKENQSKITSEQNKKSWADPETRAKRIAGIKLAAAKRKAAKEAAILQSSIDLGE